MTCKVEVEVVIYSYLFSNVEHLNPEFLADAPTVQPLFQLVSAIHLGNA